MKKVIVSIGVFVIAAAVVYVYPYLRILKNLHILTEGNVQYALEYCEKENQSKDYTMVTTVNGYKSGDKISGFIDDSKKESFFYNLSTNECLLNIKMLASGWIKNVENNWIMDSLTGYLENVYISKGQLAMIMQNEESERTVEDVPLQAFLGAYKDKAWKIKKVKSAEGINADQKTLYRLENAELELYVSLPKKEGNQSEVEFYYVNDSNIHRIKLRYQVIDSIYIKVPESQISDEIVEVLETLYEWYKGQNK